MLGLKQKPTATEYHPPRLVTTGVAGNTFTFFPDQVVLVPKSMDIPKVLIENSIEFLGAVNPHRATFLDAQRWTRDTTPRPEPVAEQVWMSAAEVLDLLGLTQAELDLLQGQGGFPLATIQRATATGTRHRWQRQQVLAWVERMRRLMPKVLR